LYVLFPKATRGLEPISYRGALLSTLPHTISYRGALLSTLPHTISYRGALLSILLHAISYRGALLSTLLHATVYVYTQFSECTSTDYNIYVYIKTALHLIRIRFCAFRHSEYLCPEAGGINRLKVKRVALFPSLLRSRVREVCTCTPTPHFFIAVAQVQG
jgi:hypothetical protein